MKPPGTTKSKADELEDLLVLGPALPVRVECETLICDADGRVIADTAGGDWSSIKKKLVCGRVVHPVTAAMNAETIARIINAAANTRRDLFALSRWVFAGSRAASAARRQRRLAEQAIQRLRGGEDFSTAEAS